MNFFKIIFLRLYKQIEIHHPQNISFGKNYALGIGSIINAKLGRIKLGKNTRIGKYNELVSDKNSMILINDYSTIYSNCKILGNISIERYCVLATNIYMSSGNHFAFEHPELLIRLQDKLVREKKVDINKPVHIHEDVWIGNGVFVSAGVTIGRGAVIGAGAVVTKNINPYDVCVGNPSKPIKKRLDFSPPIKIDAYNQNHRPYFYQGFDHLNSFPNQHKNGFPILDTGILYLSNNASLFTISGYSSIESEITISMEGKTQKQVVPTGVFCISFNKESPNTNSYSILTITSNKNSPHIFIKAVTGKTS